MFARAAQDHPARIVPAAILILGLLALAAGCGGDKDEAPAAHSRQSLVPGAADSAAAGTTAADSTTVAVPADAGLASGEFAPESRPDQPDDSAALKPSGTGQAAASGPSTAARTRGTTPGPSATGGAYSLQLGSFAKASNARAQVERIRELGYPAEVEVATLGGQTYHRVVLSGLADRAEAERLGEHIRSALGITYLVRQK